MIKLKQLLEAALPIQIPLKIMMAEMDKFTEAYITTAYFTETDNSEPSGGHPLDKNYTLEELDANAFVEMLADCRDFQKKYRHIYDEAGWSDEEAGKDFWLSRNGHGTGFFDSDGKDETVREYLQNVSRSYGEYSLYIGDGTYAGLVCGTG
jgi:hypothetical protein